MILLSVPCYAIAMGQIMILVIVVVVVVVAEAAAAVDLASGCERSVSSNPHDFHLQSFWRDLA